MNQLALFEMPGDEPMPILVAQKYHFALQHHEVDGKEWFAIQDWITGVARTDNPRRFWGALKKRLEKGKVELSTWCVQLAYIAENGRTYQMDFATDEGLYIVTQRMDSSTGIRDEILRYLARAGVFADRIRRNPLLGIEATRQSYLRQGKDEIWIDKRIQSVDRVKLLFADVNRVCAAPRYWDIINTEYKNLFGKIASELREITGSKSVRDALPDLQLDHLALAETKLRMVLARVDRMTSDEICNAAREICIPLGAELAAFCEKMGVDRATGKPLLEGAQ